MHWNTGRTKTRRLPGLKSARCAFHLECVESEVKRIVSFKKRKKKLTRSNEMTGKCIKQELTFSVKKLDVIFEIFNFFYLFPFKTWECVRVRAREKEREREERSVDVWKLELRDKLNIFLELISVTVRIRVKCTIFCPLLTIICLSSVPSNGERDSFHFLVDYLERLC